MDPRTRLVNARVAVKEGRFAEALREYVWFHNNALKYESSLGGVRLSYALSDWIRLGKVYPNAIVTLERIRDKKVALLLKGPKLFSLFHDVASINHYLKNEQSTCALFKELDRNCPDFARSCASVALEALVKCGDFILATRYFGDPESALLRYSNQLNSRIYDLEIKSPDDASSVNVYVRMYCSDVQKQVSILRGMGKSDDAEYSQLWAVALVDQQEVRKEVERMIWSNVDA
jgi:hypothetical protein